MTIVNLINVGSIEVDAVLDEYIGDEYDFDITNLGDISIEQCEVNGYIITVVDNGNGSYNVKVES